MSEKTPMIFFVTAPNTDVAQNLATKLVENKLVACVNIVRPITSIYWWKGKIEKDEECLLIMKTPKSSELIEFVQKNHPYEVPECIGFKIETGSPKYLNWIMESTK